MSGGWGVYRFRVVLVKLQRRPGIIESGQGCTRNKGKLFAGSNDYQPVGRLQYYLAALDIFARKGNYYKVG